MRAIRAAVDHDELGSPSDKLPEERGQRWDCVQRMVIEQEDQLARLSQIYYSTEVAALSGPFDWSLGVSDRHRPLSMGVNHRHLSSCILTLVMAGRSTSRHGFRAGDVRYEAVICVCYLRLAVCSDEGEYCMNIEAARRSG